MFLQLPVYGLSGSWVVPDHPNQFPLSQWDSLGSSSKVVTTCTYVHLFGLMILESAVGLDVAIRGTPEFFSFTGLH